MSWADAMLCADGPVRTLAGLWLAPERRRGYGALYEAVNHGRIDIGGRRRVAGRLALLRAVDGRLVLAAAVSNWLRPGAHQPAAVVLPVYGRGKGQAQMIPGWPDSTLEPGRTRIQHLDLDARIVRLPACIDRIARSAYRGHPAFCALRCTPVPRSPVGRSPRFPAGS